MMYEFDVEEHGGGITRLSREVLERGNAVAILGHDPVRDQVVLGNEFRPGVLVAGATTRIGTISSRAQ
jgi:ADP-ribose pyrophosphatase